ncbi:MAG: hypothetical protein PW792_16320 [Acidobacteriaceae bacterium]|nr:hypothetical protein [Acidobacteriaceae bacterium]
MKMLSIPVAALMVALPLCAGATGPDKKDPASYNLDVTILGSAFSHQDLRIYAEVEGRREWLGCTLYNSVDIYLLAPGHYKAFKEARDKKRPDYDLRQTYYMWLPDGKIERCGVEMVGQMPSYPSPDAAAAH